MDFPLVKYWQIFHVILSTVMNEPIGLFMIGYSLDLKETCVVKGVLFSWKEVGFLKLLPG